MSSIILIDDAGALSELFAGAIRAELDHSVRVVVALADVGEALNEGVFDLALVDMSFPQEGGTGLDALVEVHNRSPLTLLAIISQGDQYVAQILRDAWELLPITTVISKTAPLAYQLGAIEQLLSMGATDVDPAIQPLLPPRRSTLRTPESFRRLVLHVGHAKLWHALEDPKTELTYRGVSQVAGLKLNTIKNYRAQLLPELQLHGLQEPTLADMHDFAVRCRAFLRPYVYSRLERGDR